MHCEDLKFALHENSVNIHAMYVINYILEYTEFQLKYSTLHIYSAS